MDIYCIPMGAKSQEQPLKDHCFGDCGKVSLGGMVDTGDVAGPCWVCTHAECPHEKGVVGPVGTSDATGDVIHIRVLDDCGDPRNNGE